MGPAMSLQSHLRRLRAQRLKSSPVERATITVCREHVPGQHSSFTGKVLIDRQRVGYLVDGETTAFDVEPGEHTVTVLLYKKGRFASLPGKPVASVQVWLDEGERAELVCGIRPEIVQRREQIEKEDLCHNLLLTGVTFVVAGIGWMLSPILWKATALLPLPESWIPVILKLTKPLALACWFGLLAAWAIGPVPRHRRSLRSDDSASKIAPLYYLEPPPPKSLSSLQGEL
jgi:hypothetical protein